MADPFAPPRPAVRREQRRLLDELDVMTRTQLAARAGQLGLAVSGTKLELAARIRNRD